MLRPRVCLKSGFCVRVVHTKPTLLTSFKTRPRHGRRSQIRMGALKSPDVLFLPSCAEVMLKSKSKRKPTTREASAEPVVLSLKERLAQKRKADRLRREVVAFTVFTFLFAAIIGAVVWFVGGFKAGIATIVGVLCTALSFKYPRYALWAFLIYMPFGGTITYTIGNSPLLQLAKDGFYIPALFGVVQYCRREKLPLLIPKKLVPPLLTLLTSCLITLLVVNGGQQFSTNGEQPILMGILGLKVLLGYIPLIVCAYYLIRNRQDLFFLVRLAVVVVLVCCALGFVQYLMLKTGYCAGTRYLQGEDQFRASLEARCFVGGALLYSPEMNQIRLPGTFVAPWQWGWFLISSSFIVFPSAFNDPQGRWRTLSLVSMGSVFVMAVLSGQRIALAIVPLAFVILLFLTGQIIYLKRFIPTAIGLTILLGILAINNPAIISQRLESFESRWEASPPYEFITEQFTWSLQQQNSPLGRGLGRATNSARVLGETALVETYYPKLIYEIGVLGTMAFLAVVTTLTVLTFRAYRSVRDPILRMYGASYWVFIVFISYNTYYYPLDVDPVAVYYWFFAGVVLKLPELVRQEKLENQEKEGSIGKKRKRLKRRSFA